MLEALPDAPGTYVVVLRNTGRVGLRVGGLGRIAVAAGYYLYVGSARGPGGLRARVARHLRVSSQPHWHIDYLRQRADPLKVWLLAGPSAQEHHWAGVMDGARGIELAVPRFGASDCRCASHLFFSGRSPRLAAFTDRLVAAGLPAGVVEWRVTGRGEPAHAPAPAPAPAR